MGFAEDASLEGMRLTGDLAITSLILIYAKVVLSFFVVCLFVCLILLNICLVPAPEIIPSMWPWGCHTEDKGSKKKSLLLISDRMS